MKKNLLMAAATLALSACCTPKQTTQNASIAGAWNVVELNGAAIDTTTLDRTPLIGFSETDSTLYGNLSCNLLTGKYEANAATGKLSLPSVGSTLMMCADMTVEEQLLNALGKVARYEVSGDTLLLKSSSGRVLIGLQRK